MAKILIASDKKIKIRKLGLNTWMTLVGGTTHIVDVDYSSTYEFYSSTISNVKIIGVISDLVIADSTLSNMDSSFKNNYFLTNASINTSGVIESISRAFESDISLEDLILNGINEYTDLDRAAKGTLSLSSDSEIFSLLDKKSKKIMFGSGIKETIAKIYSADAIAMSTGIKTDGSLDLINLKFDRDKLKDFAESNVLQDIDIVSVAGSVIRKKYEPSSFDKTKDDNYDFEMDLKQSESNSCLINNNDKVKASNFDKATNSGYDFEIDLKQNVSNSYLVNNNDKVKIPDFDDTIDDNYDFEMDLIPAYTLQ